MVSLVGFPPCAALSVDMVFWSLCHLPAIGNLSKTVEDGDGNVGKTMKLITQDKKRT